MRRRFSLKNLLVWVALGLFIFGLVLMNRSPNEEYTKVPVSDFLNAVSEKKIQNVTVFQGSAIAVGKHINTKQQLMTYFPQKYSVFMERLLDSQATVEVVYPNETMSFWMAFLVTWLPNLILIGVIVYANLGRFQYGKSRTKKADSGNFITLDDVAGLPEAKDEVKEVIDFLKHPASFIKIGARIPRGILLYGPPGTGKTLLARAIAGEARVPFLYTSGSEFAEVFVGVGPKRIRELFKQAREIAPCIVFIDEIDALGKKRDSRFQNDERESTLNQLLVELDGFDRSEGVIIIFSTNRPEILDEALLRPGRVDRKIEVRLPYAQQRFEIFKRHAQNKQIDPDGINFKSVIHATAGCSGADIERIMNEAAIRVGRQMRNYITTKDVEWAMEHVVLGSKASLKMKKEELELTAHHEAGHVIATMKTPNSDPIFKATIVPTTKALGMVIQLPDDESFSYSKAQAEDKVCVLMAGRIGEIMHVGEGKVTAGASNDFEVATDIAYKYVGQWGMDEVIGCRKVDRDFSRVSPETLATMDTRVGVLLNAQRQRCEKILSENIDAKNKVAAALLELETLSLSDIEKIVGGEYPESKKDSGEYLYKKT